jgi:hypothetical protein
VAASQAFIAYCSSRRSSGRFCMVVLTSGGAKDPGLGSALLVPGPPRGGRDHPSQEKNIGALACSWQSMPDCVVAPP